MESLARGSFRCWHYQTRDKGARLFSRRAPSRQGPKTASDRPGLLEVGGGGVVEHRVEAAALERAHDLVHAAAVIDGPLLEVLALVGVPARLGRGACRDRGDPKRDDEIAELGALAGRDREIKLVVPEFDNKLTSKKMAQPLMLSHPRAVPALKNITPTNSHP